MRVIISASNRGGSSTHFARGNGVTASSTNSMKVAVERVALKLKLKRKDVEGLSGEKEGIALRNVRGGLWIAEWNDPADQGCDHYFQDTEFCLKCGWRPPKDGAGAAAPEPKPQEVRMVWKRVQDEMPDDETTVLIALSDGEVWTGFHDGDGWRYVSADLIENATVTHWAHLPEGPKS